MAVAGVRFLTILSLLSEKIQMKMSSQLSGVSFLKKWRGPLSTTSSTTELTDWIQSCVTGPPWSMMVTLACSSQVSMGSCPLQLTAY